MNSRLYLALMIHSVPPLPCTPLYSTQGIFLRSTTIFLLPGRLNLRNILLRMSKSIYYWESLFDCELVSQSYKSLFFIHHLSIFVISQFSLFLNFPYFHFKFILASVTQTFVGKSTYCSCSSNLIATVLDKFASSSIKTIAESMSLTSEFCWTTSLLIWGS